MDGHFDYAIDVVLKNEGGISDNPSDPGGLTNSGITFRLYLQSYPQATKEEFLALSLAQKKDFYKKQFWDVAPFDKINSMRLVTSVFDLCVNAGISQGVKTLQRGCNTSSTHIDVALAVDGVMGKKTLFWTNNLESSLILRSFREQRVIFYQNLVKEKPDLRVFLDGWINRAQT